MTIDPIKHEEQERLKGLAEQREEREERFREAPAEIDYIEVERDVTKQRREGGMSFEEQYPADECAGCREYEQERVRLTARLAEAEARRLEVTANYEQYVNDLRTVEERQIDRLTEQLAAAEAAARWMFVHLDTNSEYDLAGSALLRWPWLAKGERDE